MALDRSAFIRPIAHRGLHDAGQGVIENTAPAFAAALAGGFGIECDIRPALDGTPMVFHDLELGRLIDAPGRIVDAPASELVRMRYRACDTPILRLSELLELVGGRVPLLVEIKSEWDPPDMAFLTRIARDTRSYVGPLAFMSFDPAVMAAMRKLSPDVPRGIVAGGYYIERDDDWWQDRLDWRERFLLRHLMRSLPARPSFFAYHVKSLPAPATTFARRVLGLPLFTWTVRTALDRTVAASHADAMIFEGFTP